MDAHFQRRPAIRLRREAWGGFALDRRGGDLLELDAQGFAVLSSLAAARTLRGLATVLRAQAHPVRIPELAQFVAALDARGFVARVAADAAELPSDAEPEPPPAGGANRLRAPLVAHWAITYRCNWRCGFCYHGDLSKQAPEPDGQTRLRLVRRLAQWGVFEVALGGGEPTMASGFCGLMAAIRAAGMVPNVTTNGLIEDPADFRALAEHAGVVHLSADQPELLDATRGPKVFERLAGTAGRLRADGVRLGMNLLLTPDNVRSIGRSLDVAVGLGLQSVTFLRPKGAWPATHWPSFPSPADLAVLADGLRSYLTRKPPLRLYVDTALRRQCDRNGTPGRSRAGGPRLRRRGAARGRYAHRRRLSLLPRARPEFRMGNLLTDELEHLWSAEPGLQARRRYAASCRGVECPCCAGSRRTGPMSWWRP